MTPTEPQESALVVGSEPAADFKKSLMDRVRAAGGTQAIDTKQLFQKLVKETIEALLELEMEEHLGHRYGIAGIRCTSRRHMRLK